MTFGHRATRAAAIFLPLMMASACGGNRASEGMGDAAGVMGMCAPVEPGLVAGATLAHVPGSYRLTLARPGNPATSSEGMLHLEPLPEAMHEMAGAATPLRGTTDIDLEAVGALRLGDLESADPASPGVLVMEMPGPSIMLRLGSEANRRDQTAFDGAYTVLTVHRIGADGFDGSWRSGARNNVTAGYFCARTTGG